MISIQNLASKEEIISKISEQLNELDLKVVEENIEKPWGAYWRIEDHDLQKFVNQFFPNDNIQINSESEQSPKILLVAPNARLSWQYHHRRQEVWKVLVGPIKTVLSENDDEVEAKEYQEGDLIKIGFGIRHRLIGADDWGVVAEIWQHTDTNNLSDENDIVRLQDDFGRK
jgi:mannose-6-phosphate isomerase-like protein (cupin superfamily)